MSDLIEPAIQTLKGIRYATLATVCKDGSPWNSPVASDIDEDLNIYWVSYTENQHSKNIRATGKVFIVVYNSTIEWGKGYGVYLQSKARELDDSDAELIRKVRLLNPGNDDDISNYISGSPRRMYQAKPVNIWSNDAEIINGEFIKDFRNSVDLAELKSAWKVEQL